MFDWATISWIFIGILYIVGVILLASIFDSHHIPIRFQLGVLYMIPSDRKKHVLIELFLKVQRKIVRRIVWNDFCNMDSSSEGYDAILFRLRHPVFRHEFFSEICKLIVGFTRYGNYGMAKACLEACHDVILTCEETIKREYGLKGEADICSCLQQELGRDSEDPIGHVNLSEKSRRIIQVRLKSMQLHRYIDDAIYTAMEGGRARILKLLLRFGEYETSPDTGLRWTLATNPLRFKIIKALLQDPHRRLTWYEIRKIASSGLSEMLFVTLSDAQQQKEKNVLEKVDELIRSALEKRKKRLNMCIIGIGTFLPHHLRLQIVGHSVVSNYKEVVAHGRDALDLLALASLVHLDFILDVDAGNLNELKALVEARLKQLI